MRHRAQPSKPATADLEQLDQELGVRARGVVARLGQRSARNINLLIAVIKYSTDLSRNLLSGHFSHISASAF